jgi:hypothetical protein
MQIFYIHYNIAGVTNGFSENSNYFYLKKITIFLHQSCRYEGSFHVLYSASVLFSFFRHQESKNFSRKNPNNITKIT